jgi:hypothetical protein
MALDDPLGLGLARAPERDPAVLAASREAPVRQGRDGVHGARVEAQHGERRDTVDRPQDRRLVEGSRQREAAVRRDRDGPHRPAMAPELGRRRQAREAGEQRRDEPRHGAARVKPRRARIAVVSGSARSARKARTAGRSRRAPTRAKS